MKMSAFHGLFWGIALIILGIGMMLRYYYNFNFPWFRIFIAFAFIYAGLWFLIQPKWISKKGPTILFSEGKMHFNEKQNEYNVVMGNGMLDLSEIDITETRSIEVSCVFGELKVRLKPGMNYMIRSDAAFANFVAPDGSSNSFGSAYYEPKDFDATKPHLKIKSNVVFGSLRIYNY